MTDPTCTWHYVLGISEYARSVEARARGLADSRVFASSLWCWDDRHPARSVIRATSPTNVVRTTTDKIATSWRVAPLPARGTYSSAFRESVSPIPRSGYVSIRRTQGEPWLLRSPIFMVCVPTLSDAKGQFASLMRTLLSEADADAGMFFRLGISRSEPRLANVLCTNEHAERLHEKCASDPSRYLGTTAQLTRVAGALERTNFLELSASLTREEFESRPIFEAFTFAGLTDQIRLFAFEGNRHIGTVVALRSSPPHFSPRERRRLKPLVGDWIRLTRGIDALSSSQEPSDTRIVAIVSPTGGVELVSGAAARRFVDAHAGEIRRWIRACDRSRHADGEVVLGAFRAWVVRVDGPPGVRYVVSAERLEPFEVSPSATLTRTQRSVAKAALAGMTNAEIASDLGMSAQTVKAHLRNIYLRLGVSSRLELAAVCGDLPGEVG